MESKSSLAYFSIASSNEMLPAMEVLKRRIADSAAAFRDVVGNPNLRRLELAWAASVLGQWAYLVAVSVYAYRAGGEAAVGLLVLLRLVPAGLIAPFAGMLADRYPRERVLVGCNVVRGGLIAAAAVCVYADVEPAVVYALAVGAAIATTPVRSAEAALTPALARTPKELTAANAVASTIESVGVFAGAALAGLLLGITSTGTVFLVMVGLVALSTLFVLRIQVPPSERRSEVQAGTIASEALMGFRAIGRDPSLRILVGLITAQTFVAGAVSVYIVVLAIEELGLGDAGVGYLSAADGVGALIGGILALSLTGAQR